MTSPILVAAAIIERDGRFLLTQRRGGGLNGGRWEFPGGKVEYGEDPRACVEREIREEIGVAVEAGELIELSSYNYEDIGKHVVLLGFRCRIVEGEIEKREIADYVWTLPEEMRGYDVTEADLPLVDALLR